MSRSYRCSMGEQVVLEWLADWAALDPAELHSFAAEHDQSQDVVEAIYTVLDERTKHPELLEPICTQLFGFYRSRESSLQRFALQFLPTFIFMYLNAIVNSEKNNHKCIETLLIGLYNLEVMDENGKPKVFSFRLPSLAQASIYHEPLTLGPAFLTEISLRRWEECNTKLVSWGPLPQVEALNAQNRAKVMTALLFVFNRHLSLLPKSALRQHCIIASRLVTQGFNNLSSKGFNTHDHRPGLGLPPRIPVSSQLLLELAHGAYFAMFNEFYTLALEAVNDIAARASYEGYPDVLLVTGAVTNSLQANPSGQPCDGPMGISVALSPATTTVTVSKSMITNASFRTKKLPDDIPIQVGGTNPAEAGDGLNSITEENETEATTNQRNTSFRNSKSKLPSFPGLGKKTKEKEMKEKIASIKNNSTPENNKKSQPPKDIIKTHSKSSLLGTAATNGENGDYPSPLLQKKIVNDMDNACNIINEEKVSLVSNSLQNSGDSSDSHSQMTSDSLDLDTAAARLATMQVSSV